MSANSYYGTSRNSGNPYTQQSRADYRPYAQQQQQQQQQQVPHYATEHMKGSSKLGTNGSRGHLTDLAGAAGGAVIGALAGGIGAHLISSHVNNDSKNGAYPKPQGQQTGLGNLLGKRFVRRQESGGIVGQQNRFGNCNNREHYPSSQQAHHPGHASRESDRKQANGRGQDYRQSHERPHGQAYARY